MEEHEGKKEQPASGTKEEEVMSEVMERAMETNVKLLVANEISHAKRLDSYSELALAQAISFQQKSNEAYLETSKRQALAAEEMSKKQAEQTLKHFSELDKQIVENNRFTLDYLYGVYPLEASGTALLMADFIDYLKSKAAKPTT
jgi:hypothetical protein